MFSHRKCCSSLTVVYNGVPVSYEPLLPCFLCLPTVHSTGPCWDRFYPPCYTIVCTESCWTDRSTHPCVAYPDSLHHLTRYQTSVRTELAVCLHAPLEAILMPTKSSWRKSCLAENLPKVPSSLEANHGWLWEHILQSAIITEHGLPVSVHDLGQVRKSLIKLEDGPHPSILVFF